MCYFSSYRRKNIKRLFSKIYGSLQEAELLLFGVPGDLKQKQKLDIMTFMSQKKWKPVRGLEHAYEINRNGKVRNLLTGKEFSPTMETIQLKGKNGYQKFEIKKLVWESFHGPIDESKYRVVGNGAELDSLSLEELPREEFWPNTEGLTEDSWVTAKMEAPRVINPLGELWDAKFKKQYKKTLQRKSASVFSPTEKQPAKKEMLATILWRTYFSPFDENEWSIESTDPENPTVWNIYLKRRPEPIIRTRKNKRSPICKRGHVIAAENETQSRTRFGFHQCRSCKNAWDWTKRNHPEAEGEKREEILRKKADEIYQKMAKS